MLVEAWEDDETRADEAEGDFGDAVRKGGFVSMNVPVVYGIGLYM